MRPSLISGRPSRIPAAATRMWHSMASSRPPPRQAPLIASMAGLSNRSTRLSNACPRPDSSEPWCTVLSSASSLMSAPGLKNFPPAVRMMTRTASSASSFPKAWSSSFQTGVVRGIAGGWYRAALALLCVPVAPAATPPNTATLRGTAPKPLPDLAAFANGALVRYLDFNDTYLSKEPAHPSDNLSAAFAAGENTEASGRQVIEAIVLAYEIQCRLCDAAALRPRGWDHVTYGPFSSALGTAKVLKLSKAQTVQAINLAGVANVALRQTRVGDLSMWKACAFANAARNGLFAAMLARQGMTGP